ncbi:MAG: hypothetical protein AB1589_07940 [Cyanobacteriota bacterium]
MVHTKAQQSSTYSPAANQHDTQISNKSQPFAVGAKPNSSLPLTLEQRENQDFQQEQFEATQLEIQAKYGTLAPEGQERLGVLQAKMQGLLHRRMDKASRFGHNFANVAIAAPENSRDIEPVQPIQTKLTLGQPGDKYEQEADSVAEQVMRIPDSATRQPIQREALPEDEQQVQTKQANSQDSLVQRYPDTILEVAQMGFAESILRLSIDQVINKKKDKKELINEAFWAAYPQINGKKITDENVPDPKQKQTYIQAYLYIQNTLYTKVEKEARKSAKPVSEETEAPLYGPWQDPKAYENWDTKENKKNPSEVVVPKPSNEGIPGLPENSKLEHPEFSAIVQEMEQMEQNPLAFEKKHGEEIGEARTERVEKIAELRDRIAALKETITDVEASQIKYAQAYLYRRLAPLAPYLGQMANTNILEKGDKGWDRTCNVTVPAMVIEGIGKTKADYDSSNIPSLKRIFNALEGKYKQRKLYEEATDFDTLRLPDFMALVGIARWMPKGLESLSDEEFVNAVSKARQTAANKTTHHETMMYLIEQFGCSHKKHSVHSSELNQIGEAQKDYTKAVLRNQNPEEWRDLYNEVEAKEKSFDKLNKNDKKRYQTLWKYEQFNKEKADELLPVDTYREAVLKKVNPLLDKGAQILVGMEQHFIRLDALDQDTVQVDDPGERGFKNLRVTWEQARNLGYFKGFWEITG